MSDEDWEDAMREVRPLKARKRAEEEQKAPRISPGLTQGPRITPPAYDGSDLTIGDATRLDGKKATRLRRGKLPIEGTLDLHGMKVDEAYSQLIRYVERAYDQQRRCLLVITGKGRGGGPGAIKQAFARWVNAPELRRFVLAVEQATAKDGGSGAYYVLLKRRKMES